jgi:hypothetical protein
MPSDRTYCAFPNVRITLRVKKRFKEQLTHLLHALLLRRKASFDAVELDAQFVGLLISKWHRMDRRPMCIAYPRHCFYRK